MALPREAALSALVLSPTLFQALLAGFSPLPAGPYVSGWPIGPIRITGFGNDDLFRALLQAIPIAGLNLID
ncbi:MAG: hypothetical protein K5905_26910 [Roseibium sp.]|uniref:hypothetical protein n=1 Tax=Roseibium sp. TaxID=1936156 RepID=UPI002604FC98|nr:hypothetical protein [Roseibium sp.]MCV0429100.1 hypothetical protein [Roseibium sp.]